MGPPKLLCCIACLLASALALAGEPGRNLIEDGGFESVREVSLGQNKYYLQNVRDGVDLGSQGPVVRVPSNLSLFSACKRLHVIEGAPGKEVRSGARAILLEGSFYLRAAGAARTGDVFRARFYAKGKGQARLILGLYGKTGKSFGQCVPKRVRPDPDKWTLIEHVLDTRTHANLRRIYPRLESKGEVFIDDVELVKVRACAPGAAPVSIPIAFAAPCDCPVAVDGRLTEPCWQRTTRNGPFVKLYDNGSVSEPLTLFRAVYDSDKVYLGIEAREPEPTAMEDKKAARDAWPSGSVVELFLDTTLNRSSYYQLAANLAGTRFDQRGKDRSWDADWQVAASKGGDRWTMEIAIPFADVEGGAPEPGSAWGLNLCRNRRGDLSYSSTWAKVGRAFHRPGLFNTLIFGTVQQWWDRQMGFCETTQATLRERLNSLQPRDAALEAKLNVAMGRRRDLAAPGPDLAPDAPEFLSLHEAVEWVKEDHRAVADESEAALALQKARAAAP